MSEVLTLRKLIDQHAGRLGLARENTNSAVEALLDIGQPGAYVSALVGHMNLIRPNRVQVLGAEELTYLESLDGDTRAAMLGHLLAPRPLCLIISDGLRLPSFLASAAGSASVPVLTASADSHQVVQELFHYLSRTWARRSSIHGVFIEVLGVGALLAGQPGVGKSELALELVSRGHRLIADDAPEFALVAPETVEGSCPPTLRDFMEVRGLGIVNVRSMFGDSAVKPRRTLRLIINLVVMQSRAYSPEERLHGIRGERDVLGVSIPEVSLPVAPGHNMAVLVECTIRNHILSMKGYSAADDFADRHQRIMSGEELPER